MHVANKYYPVTTTTSDLPTRNHALKAHPPSRPHSYYSVHLQLHAEKKVGPSYAKMQRQIEMQSIGMLIKMKPRTNKKTTFQRSQIPFYASTSNPPSQ
jgi:hypothetical protein